MHFLTFFFSSFFFLRQKGVCYLEFHKILLLFKQMKRKFCSQEFHFAWDCQGSAAVFKADCFGLVKMPEVSSRFFYCTFLEICFT